MRKIQVFHDTTVEPTPGKYEITLPQYQSDGSPNIAGGKYVRLQTDDGRTKQVLKVRIVRNGKGDAGYLNDGSKFSSEAVVQMQEVDVGAYRHFRFRSSSKTLPLSLTFLAALASSIVTFLVNFHKDPSTFGFSTAFATALLAWITSGISLLQHYLNPD